MPHHTHTYTHTHTPWQMRILSEISEPLKEELRVHLVGDTLDKLSFFTNLDTNAIMLLLKVNWWWWWKRGWWWWKRGWWW